MRQFNRPRLVSALFCIGVMSTSLLVTPQLAQAQATTQPAPTQQTAADQIYGVPLNAAAYVVGDVGTGRVVAYKNPDKRLMPASLTKLMTVYLLFSALQRGDITLDTEMPISEKAWRMGGSKMFVEVGKTVKVRDLIHGIIVDSGNDACIVVAEYLGGTEDGFVQMMNAKAQQMGMTNTTFKDASGWPEPGHLVTARDLFTLTQHIIKDFPQYYHFFSVKDFTYSGIHQNNRNGLLFRNVGVDGLKTGHAEDVGYNLIASEQRDGARFAAVILGTNSEQARENEALKGLTYAFGRYRDYTVQAKGTAVAEAPVWYGMADKVPLVTADDVTLTLSTEEKAGLKVQAVYPNPLEAPITKGQQIGALEVTVPGMSPVKVPLLAGADVAQKGPVARVVERAEHYVGL